VDAALQAKLVIGLAAGHRGIEKMIFLFLAAQILNAQAAPKFEAVSIHRYDDNAGLRSGPARATSGWVTAECATLGGPFPGLISESYGMFADGHRCSPTLSPPIEGGPSCVYALTISKNGSKLRGAEGPACVPVAGKPCLSGLRVQGHNLVLNLAP
jgi:hypothetical protein